jgi:DtxR family Mn-dependent transcriptional regulator
VHLGDLSPAAQGYLKVLWTLGEWSSEPITTTRLASALSLAPSTVSESVRKLADAGLLHHQPYGAISLSPAGRRLAVAMVRRHRLIETFLARILGYDWDEVHEEADDLEHLVSDRFIDRIDGLLGHPDRDPHGDPIPGADGQMPPLPDRRLCDISMGIAARVSRVSDASADRLRLLASLGLRVGSAVTVVCRLPEGLLVRVDRQAPTRLSGDAAAAVWVADLPPG